MSKEQQGQSEEEFFTNQSIDDMIESSPVIGEEEPKEEPKDESKEEPKEEPDEGKVEDQDQEDAKQVEAEPEKPEEGLTDESFEELSGKYPVLKEYKKFFDDYNNWEKKLRQKSQFISWFNKLDPEQQELVTNKNLPLVYGKEELPKSPKELVDSVMKGVKIDPLRYVDEDELEVNVPTEKVEPLIRSAVENALNTAVPEMAALRKQLTEFSEKSKELEERLSASTQRQGELEMEKLAAKHRDFLDFKRVDDDESIVGAVKRINDAGEEHPEYSKLAKWNAIGTLADRNDWSLDRAYEMLYGSEERTISETKAMKEAAKKNQEDATQEDVSGDKPVSEDWERAFEGMSEHSRKLDDVWRKAGV